jgi:hypothetical protein
MTDQLFENGCRLCGIGDIAFTRASGAHCGATLCQYCYCNYGQSSGVDAEITRRLALAQKATTHAEAVSLRPFQETQPASPPPAPERKDPYVEHRELLSDCCMAEARIESIMVELDRKRGNRQREAFRLLDRPIPGPKYPDGVLWESWSTPGWDGP